MIPHLMYGKEVPVFDSAIIQGMDAVVLGMSSSPKWAEVEIAVAKTAQDAGKPYGFYSDIFKCHRRGWFSPFRESASFVFAFNPADVEDAQQCFPNAKVVATGNPTHASYFDFQVSPTAVEEALGLQKTSQVILVCGVKSFPMNVELILAIINACRKMSVKPEVVFGLHPGDPNDRAGYEAVVRSIGELPIRFVTKAEMPSSHILCRADMLIESTGSLGIEAACKRKPVVSFLTPRAYDLLYVESGEKIWTPAVQGTSTLVENELELACAIQDGAIHHQIVCRQKGVYPKSDVKGQALIMMADVLDTLVSPTH